MVVLIYFAFTTNRQEQVVMHKEDLGLIIFFEEITIPLALATVSSYGTVADERVKSNLLAISSFKFQHCIAYRKPSVIGVSK